MREREPYEVLWARETIAGLRGREPIEALWDRAGVNIGELLDSLLDEYAHALADRLRSQTKPTVDSTDYNAAWWHAAAEIHPASAVSHRGEPK